MARKRLSMRKTSEVLRLKHEVGLTNRQIARSLGLTHPTVSKYLDHAQQAGLTWPLPEDLDEDRLDQLLFRGGPHLLDSRTAGLRWTP